MKKLMIFLFSVISISIFSQEKETKEDVNKIIESIKKEIADKTCKCIDSVKDEVINRKRKENIEGINGCVKEYTGAYMLGKKLAAVDKTKDSKININLNEKSQNYLDSKRELEDYLMKNCESMKFVLATNDRENENSVSQNPKARDYYTKGVNESNNKNYAKALEYFLLAVKEDSNFPFAWDNLGYCYRQLGEYDKAIEAYKKSIELDPNHAFPIQNLAVAYTYKKEYQKAIDTFELLKKLDSENPEIYYGIGQIYFQYLKEYEKSLDYMCKAFNLYIKNNSPYRADAENIIRYNFTEMKKLGKEDKFYEILKANNINTK
ncbi:tetratricopeptide repeat protein [Cloacibacterium caeni]|uniref:tetratricopeptide repeat protein n=1 Tax=Cloacibacterium caeni TaxID=2004710 RepID=UPI001BCEE755|nr:tetratricopeptide repeat protein [Cloacibacterium caeni]